MTIGVLPFISRLSILVLILGSVQAQIDYDNIKTPSNAKWLKDVDLSKIPKLPVRAVGSGICPESNCDGDDNDRCFESCGNKPSQDDIYGCPKDHEWALTFDDGPSKYTNELLDYLDKEDIKATFCVMGSHVQEYPDVLKRAYQAGHQIASHTYSHPHLMSLTNEQIINEVKATEEEIEKVIGVKPHYIRPPFGEADDRVKGLMKAMGYKVLLWNVDPTDYDVYMLRNVSAAIQGSFKMAVQGNDTGLNLHEDPGFISLQHDLYKQSVDQVPKVIELLKGKGYRFLTAAACNNDMKPHTITDDSLAAMSVKDNNNSTTTTNVPPNVLPNNVSTTVPAQANKKAVVSGSSITNANYIVSFATLVISTTFMFNLM